MWLFLLASVAQSKWELQQKVVPRIDNKGIFGRSVALSNAEHNRLIVGASWENVDGVEQRGKIYVYSYNAETGNYEQFQELVPEDGEGVVFNNVGSTCKVSADGRRIVAGAPYSTVENREGKPLQEVGALCVWDFDDKQGKFVQTKIIKPVEYPTEEEDAMQGFGRSLAITPDGKSIASAYYNKPKVSEFKEQQGAVFVTTQISENEWKGPQKLVPDAKYNGRLLKFGSDLAFVDATHLVVAVTLFEDYWDAGTCYFSMDSNYEWNLEQEILPDDVTKSNYKDMAFSSYGDPISMPNQNTLGIGAAFDKGAAISGAFFLLDKSETGWSTKNPQVIEFPKSIDCQGLSFCGSDTFMTHASNVPHPSDPSKTTEAIYIYRRNSTGLFELKNDEILYPPNDAPSVLVFGSDMAWASDCSYVAIGGMAKYYYDENDPVHSNQPAEGSATYIYRNIVEPEEEDDGLSAGEIAGITVACCVVVIAGVVGIVLFLKRRMTSNAEA